jgi:hypothetical protein
MGEKPPEKAFSSAITQNVMYKKAISKELKNPCTQRTGVWLICPK